MLMDAICLTGNHTCAIFFFFWYLLILSLIASYEREREGGGGEEKKTVGAISDIYSLDDSWVERI